MKRILVLQLARFGDIYQTWPSLNALKRRHPGAEIHVLVRARFREALDGLDGLYIHELATAEILKPVLESGSDSEALARLNDLIDELAALEFDQVINLSFSPFSSFLTDAIRSVHTDVRGYTRHSDGFLAIPDDASAYFYAQVGIGRPNRFHLTDVFAAVCGVDLCDADFAASASAGGGDARENRILLHLGASQADKVYPGELWVKVAASLSSAFHGEMVVIGSQSERSLAEAVCGRVSGVMNLAGKTNLRELTQLIGRSQLLIGADSAPVHIAGLTGTPVLNLSSSTVNFWETGPVSAGSRVLYAQVINDIQPERIAAHALGILNAEDPDSPCFARRERGGPFVPVQTSTDDFAWNLIQALYTATPYPLTTERADRLAFQRLFELAELAIQQLAQWDGSAQSTAAKLLGSIDKLLVDVASFCPNVNPVVQWFQTQRLRLPPAEPGKTLAATRRLFEELIWVAAVYHEPKSSMEEARYALDLCGKCALDLREYDFATIESTFQELLSRLHTLARQPSEAGEPAWSSVLDSAQNSLTRQDFIALADLLEYDLAPRLKRMTSGAGETEVWSI